MGRYLLDDKTKQMNTKFQSNKKHVVTRAEKVAELRAKKLAEKIK